MTPPQIDPKTETLTLLARIAAATESTRLLLSDLHDEIQRSNQINQSTADSNTANFDRILAAIGAALATAPAPAPAPAGSPGSQTAPEGYTDFSAENLTMTYNDDGTPAYRIKGGPYSKFGVRAWPEILPALGVDPATLKPGPNPFAARVRALLGENGPRKIIGLATNGATPQQPRQPAADEPPF